MWRSGCNRARTAALLLAAGLGLGVAAGAAAAATWTVITLGFDPAAASRAEVERVATARLRGLGLTARVVTEEVTEEGARAPDEAVVAALFDGPLPELPSILTENHALGFHPFPRASAGTACDPASPPPGMLCVRHLDPERAPLAVSARPALSGEIVAEAAAVVDGATGGVAVDLRLTHEAAAGFCDVTKRTVGDGIAAVQGGVALTAPLVYAPICGGKVRLLGIDGAAEAEALAIQLARPLYPAAVTVRATSVIEATPGYGARAWEMVEALRRYLGGMWP